MFNVSTKECGVCKIVKPTSEFYVEKRRQAPKWECKCCTTLLADEYRLAHPDRNLAAVKKNRAKYPEKAKAVDRNMHRRKQFRAFKITQDDLERTLTAQNGVCAICKTAEVHLDGGKHVHLDHCHKTGKFRGILCLKCNVILGMAGDDTERLLSAIDYLKLHSANAGN